MAEFVGTLMLASLVLAQANAVGAILTSTWFVAATAGLTLAVLVLALGRVSGGHFNPAVTLGAWSVRKVETTLKHRKINLNLSNKKDNPSPIWQKNINGKK